MAGRIVLEKKPLPEELLNGSVPLDTQLLAEGLYILSIHSGAYSQNIKLVK
jgi:hypothetical protein